MYLPTLLFVLLPFFLSAIGAFAAECPDGGKTVVAFCSCGTAIAQQRDVNLGSACLMRKIYSPCPKDGRSLLNVNACACGRWVVPADSPRVCVGDSTLMPCKRDGSNTAKDCACGTMKAQDSSKVCVGSGALGELRDPCPRDGRPTVNECVCGSKKARDSSKVCLGLGAFGEMNDACPRDGSNTVKDCACGNLKAQDSSKVCLGLGGELRDPCARDGAPAVRDCACGNMKAQDSSKVCLGSGPMGEIRDPCPRDGSNTVKDCVCGNMKAKDSSKVCLGPGAFGEMIDECPSDGSNTVKDCACGSVKAKDSSKICSCYLNSELQSVCTLTSKKTPTPTTSTPTNAPKKKEQKKKGKWKCLGLKKNQYKTCIKKNPIPCIVPEELKRCLKINCGDLQKSKRKACHKEVVEDVCTLKKYKKPCKKIGCIWANKRCSSLG